MNNEIPPIHLDTPSQGKHKILPILIAVLATAIIVGGGVFALEELRTSREIEKLQQEIFELKKQANQNNENIGINLYKNEAYQFEYPSNVYIDEKIYKTWTSLPTVGLSSNNYRGIIGETGEYKSGFTIGINVEILEDKFKNSSLPEVLNARADGAESTAGAQIFSGYVDIGGRIVYKGVNKGMGFAGEFSVVHIQERLIFLSSDNKKLVTIELFAKEEEGQNYEKALNQIISTFKFLDTSTAADEPISTADWKIYRNQTYSYEISYPGDWNLDTSLVKDVIIIPNIKPAEYYSSDWVTISVKVEDNPKYLSVDDWLGDSDSYYSKKEADAIQESIKAGERAVGIGYSENKTSINGMSALEQRVGGEGGGVRNVILLKGRQIYILSVSSELGFVLRSKPELLAEQRLIIDNFEKIVSIFKFTD